MENEADLEKKGVIVNRDWILAWVIIFLGGVLWLAFLLSIKFQQLCMGGL